MVHPGTWRAVHEGYDNHRGQLSMACRRLVVSLLDPGSRDSRGDEEPGRAPFFSVAPWGLYLVPRSLADPHDSLDDCAAVAIHRSPADPRKVPRYRRYRNPEVVVHPRVLFLDRQPLPHPLHSCRAEDSELFVCVWNKVEKFHVSFNSFFMIYYCPSEFFCLFIKRLYTCIFFRKIH